MTLAKIPSQVPLVGITELSPSRYTWLRDGCAYSFLLESSLRSYSGPSMLMPPVSFNNVIGTIIHKIFQLVNSRQLECSEEAITQEWVRLCHQHQENIKEQYPTIRNVAIGDYDAMYDTIDVAQVMCKGDAPNAGASHLLSHLNEHYIKIDNLLKGSIDRIRPNADGYEIVDYKTGKIFSEDGNIKQEYVAQLNLYAYMLTEKENVNISGLVIIDRMGNEIPVPYYKDKKAIFFAQVSRLIKDINDAVAENAIMQLCRPSEDNCNFCPCQHLCHHRIVSPDNPFHIIEGSVSRAWNNDQISIQVDGAGEIVIAKLGVLGLGSLSNYVGKRLIFVNLLQIIEGELYNRCDKTAIYERV